MSKENLRFISKPPDHLPQPREMLPILTVNHPNKPPLKFTEDEIDDLETEWIIYTSHPGGKGIGA